MPSALLPLLLFAPPGGAPASPHVTTTARPESRSRMVRQHQDGGFVIIDGHPAVQVSASIAPVKLGTGIGIDPALVDGRDLRRSGTGR